MVSDRGEARSFYQYVREQWGTGESLRKYAPSKADDPEFQAELGSPREGGATPAAAIALMRMNQEIEISGVLSAIRVPTLVIHRTDDTAVSIEGGRFLAQHIPNARLVEFSGADHLPYIGENADQIADEIEEFVTGSPPVVEGDRILATGHVHRHRELDTAGPGARRPPLALIAGPA